MDKELTPQDVERYKAIEAFDRIIENRDNFYNEKEIEKIRYPLVQIFKMFDNMFISMHVSRRKIKKKFLLDFDYLEKTIKTSKTKEELLAFYDRFYDLSVEMKKGILKITSLKR